MAKGLRASSKKSNKSKLRNRVFGPVEAARNERLSAKLLSLAHPSQAATTTDSTQDQADADVQKDVGQQASSIEKEQLVEDMDIDGASTTKTTSSATKTKKAGKVQKKKHRRARNDITFRSLGTKRKSKDRVGRA